MSLIHWWQLNGNLKDYGTNPITLTNNGATVDNNGKIGKCYYLNGSSNFLRAAYPNTIKPTDVISICGWYKASSVTTAHHIISCYEAGGAGLTAAGDRSFMIMQVYTGGAYHDARTSFPDTNWHHWAGTFDGRYIKIYLDGVLKGTTDLGSGTHTISYNSTTPWMIGANPTPYGSPGGDYTNGYVNDIRIYDHALSQKEVKEISKGLILDYNFEELTRENLLKTPLEVYRTKDNKTTIGNLDISNLDLSTLPGKTLVFSFDYSIEGDKYYTDTSSINTYRFGIHGSMTYGSSQKVYPFANYLTMSGTGRAVMKYKIHSSYTNITDFHLSNQTYNRPANGNTNTWYIKNLKLEIVPSSSDTASEFYGTNDDIVRDNSGYGNNATIYGNLSLSTSSATGKYSAVFNGTNSYTSTPQLTFIKNSLTVNVWAYKDNWGGSDIQKMVSCTEAGGYQVCIDENSQVKFMCHSNGSYHTAEVARSTLTSGWHMFTGTYDGSNVKFYIDGLQVATTSASGNIGYGNTFLALGVEPSGSGAIAGDWFNGKISDFKIYATALSANDIKLEYQRKASIDKNGNLFSPEFIEDNTNIKITNTQITKAGQFVEGNTKAQFKETYDDNSNVIHINQVKEV